MSLVGKNRKIFSYSNDDRTDRNFMYKDFEKTKSYNTDFSRTKFSGVSFRAAHMKYCKFDKAVFSGVDFIGTNLRGSTFIGADFKECIFSSANFDKTNFTNAVFQDCYVIGSGISSAKGITLDTPGVIFLCSSPSQNSISSELRGAVEQLRSNDVIRKSHTLHCKKGTINTVTMKVLEEIYSEKQLIILLPQLPKLVTAQFYTVSYLKALLKKAEQLANI